MLQRRGKLFVSTGNRSRISCSFVRETSYFAELSHRDAGYVAVTMSRICGTGASNYASTRFLLKPESLFAFVKITVLSNVTPCSLVDSEELGASVYLFSILHDATSQNIVDRC